VDSLTLADSKVITVECYLRIRGHTRALTNATPKVPRTVPKNPLICGGAA